MVSDIRPEPELKADFIERNPVTTTVQVAPELSEHEVRTARFPAFRSQHHQTRYFFFRLVLLLPVARFGCAW